MMPLALILSALLTAGASAAPDPTGTVVLAPIQTTRLSPDLASVLPGLLAAAIESGARYQVLLPQDPQHGAPAVPGSWRLEVRVTGKGPWRLEARAARDREGGSTDRVKAKKQPFHSRADLSLAVDAVAAALVSGMSAAGPPVEGEGGTVPLSRELSASDEAVDAYLKALSALRGGDASESLALLDRALQSDPDFRLAAAERTWTLWSSDSLFPAISGPGPGGGPAATTDDQPRSLVSVVGRAMGQLRAGDAPHAIQAGELLHQRSPALKWGHAPRGLSLAAMGRLSESADDWVAVAAADPADPRGVLWLAAARMAAGEFIPAAEGFASVRASWPGLLRLYVLEAEARARGRDTEGARKALEAMKTWMSGHGIIPHSDETNPDLMLGSVDLLEGHYDAAKRRFTAALETAEKEKLPSAATDTLHLAVLRLQRDSVVSSDPLKRQREFEDNYAALEHWEESLSPEERAAQRTRFLRLRGMVQLKEGNTVETWKTVEAIRALSDTPGYSEFDDAILSAATMLKEGDEKGCVGQLERAARSSNRTVDLIYLGQMQLRTGESEKARATFDQAEDRLMHFRPAPGGGAEDLVITQPHFAARVPIFLYSRAALAFETGRGQESRYYFSRLLKYYQTPDQRVKALAEEARDRGAVPE